MTTDLNTTYKNPIPTPCVLLCKAEIVRQDGRKVFVNGTIEDGQGKVYSTGEGMFIERRSRL